MEISLKELGGFFPPYAQPSVVLNPADSALDGPASRVAAQGSSVSGLVFRLSVAAMRRNHFDPLFGEGFVKRIAVVGLVADHSRGQIAKEAGVQRRVDKGYSLADAVTTSWGLGTLIGTFVGLLGVGGIAGLIVRRVFKASQQTANVAFCGLALAILVTMIQADYRDQQAAEQQKQFEIASAESMNRFRQKLPGPAQAMAAQSQDMKPKSISAALERLKLGGKLSKSDPVFRIVWWLGHRDREFALCEAFDRIDEAEKLFGAKLDIAERLAIVEAYLRYLDEVTELDAETYIDIKLGGIRAVGMAAEMAARKLLMTIEDTKASAALRIARE